jgi:tetratricopeptide (TPR) repeat protein
MADASLQSAMDGAAAQWDQALETSARLLRVHLHYATEAAGSEENLIRDVEQAIPVLEQLGDRQGLARAWRLLALVNGTAGRYGAAERAAQQAIEYARQAGDRLMEARVLPWVAVTAMYGPTPVAQVIARCEEILEKVADDRKAQAHTLRALALLQAMQGSFDRARESYRRSRANLEELGWKLGAAMTSLVSGAVEMLAGDPVAAEAELRRDYEAYVRMGERNYISTTAGDLAEALYQQGRYVEAEEYCRISEEVAAPDDVSSQVRWRCVRGKLLARRGRLDEAETLVREALALMKGSDEPDSHGNTLMDLAEVLRLSGRPDKAIPAIEEAAELFELKGNVVSLRRARALLAEAYLRT